MPPARDVTSSLALWLHLRRRAADGPALTKVEPPAGAGALILVHLSEQEDDPPHTGGVIKALLARRPSLRFAFTGARPTEGALPASSIAPLHFELPENMAAARGIVERLKPEGLLLLGDALPAALISAMSEAHLPVVMAEARLAPRTRQGAWRSVVNRGLLRRLTRVLVPDTNAGAAALQWGVEPDRIELTGPVTETRPPLSANEAERAALAQILRGRHVWLAAAPTLPETMSALRAHQSALQHNHRALLILAALPDDQVAAIKAEAEALGLATVLRSEDEDPMADDHVLIAEDPYEMGLWYRLAPVCFMGGTLFPGPALAPRHPFEPAALGSAIIHGPQAGNFSAEWQQLGGAQAARLVTDTDSLARAVADLTAPDQAALLAGNAWSVSTGGAAVTRRIADSVIDAIEEAG